VIYALGEQAPVIRPDAFVHPDRAALPGIDRHIAMLDHA